MRVARVTQNKSSFPSRVYVEFGVFRISILAQFNVLVHTVVVLLLGLWHHVLLVRDPWHSVSISFVFGVEVIL